MTAMLLSLVSVVVFAACTSSAPAAAPQPESSAPPAPAAVQQTPTSEAVESTTTEASVVSTPILSKPVISEVTESTEFYRPPSGTEDIVPEIRGIESWINSEPLTFEENRGKVVLVDFWTYTCVNCIRTMPFLRAWNEKYTEKGLLIVGVHAPEFDFEKIRENVIQASADLGVVWPVAQDNDMETWRAFNNRFWPAKYLIDKDGRIRYTHFGEGSYDETEAWIRGLLEEAGADLSEIPANTVPEPQHDDGTANITPEMGLTRELYAGYERNYGIFQSRSAPPYVRHVEFYEQQDADILYSDPGDHQNHFLYLQGLWQNGFESLTHARETENYEDYLAIKFFATSVNVVMSPESVESVEVRVLLNDEPVGEEDAGPDVMYDDEGNTYVTVDEARMYNIINLSDYEGHELKLTSNSPDFAVFAYTFGAYEGGEPTQTGPNG